MVCLTMSLPIFSRIDTGTEELVCIPKHQATQAVIDLKNYDFCSLERDTLLNQIEDLKLIISKDSSVISYYEGVTDSLVLVNKQCLEKTATLNLEMVSKDDKITKLRNTRNLTILTTVLTAVLPAVLNKNE